MITGRSRPKPKSKTALEQITRQNKYKIVDGPDPDSNPNENSNRSLLNTPSNLLPDKVEFEITAFSSIEEA